MRDAPPEQKSTLTSPSERERGELADFVQQSHGPSLSRAAFNDALCLVLEDVSGFESADESILQLFTDDLWPIYQANIKGQP